MNMNITAEIREKFNRSWWGLRITYGLLFVIAGADKFFNLVTHWEKYISPMLLQFVPVTSMQFIYGVGIIEIIIGVLILFVMTRAGAYLAALWLFFIVFNLLSMATYFDIAVRDTVMAIGAIVLAQLTDIKEELSK